MLGRGSELSYARPPLAHRTSSFGSGSRSLKIVTEMGQSGTYHSGGASPFGQSAATAVRDSREREKKEMSDLNDKLASYIEKVRFLEAQNRKIGADLDSLRNKWGKDTHNIKQMYESELKEAHKLIDDTTKQKEDLSKELKDLLAEVNNYKLKYSDAQRERSAEKERLNEILTTLSNLESEIHYFQRKIARLEDETKRIKGENHQLVMDLQQARTELDQETLNRIDHQNQVQTLLEEIEFLRRVHEQEIRELQLEAARDTTPENREYFKNELSSAIRDIRQEYDQITNLNKTDMESWYRLKVQEIQTQSARQNIEQGYAKEEVKRLRVQLTDLRGKLADLESKNGMLEKQIQELNYQLEDDQRSYENALTEKDNQIRRVRDECQNLMVELQMLLDTKQTLDNEIKMYRKMLDGEDSRPGLRQLVDQALVKKDNGFHAESLNEARVDATRHSYQRSAKGNVSIQEVSPEGNYVILNNTHRSKEEKLGDWKLRRSIDGGGEVVFTFPKKFVLRPGKSVKIFAKGKGINSPPDQLEAEEIKSFGAGTSAQTMLYNKDGEERATFIQRVSN
ncbi:unnamed protein product [Bursaphelenchus xylophilus]|uniref:(pine wood nematode) hypothetical protein n=1 Tax=Bursaphelenchus xylophilus TaxID=6326 RepID=A0A1I7S0J7_BURXY|nr:unnamed protein product [Bursaphelenchus xylophilus]CAG9132292.1 unnamed protein product [Bursaphelenchus xylophilus]